MANYYEKISVLIDVTTDKAVSGFKNFKTAVKDAEGFTGKLKAGVGSLKESLGGMVSGPAGMAAAGTAIAAAGAFAFDSAQKFIGLARETENLATATGLTNEEASRLIEVFGDLGGDATALQAALSKIPKTLDSGKWEEYGIATRNAGGELRSTNEVLLDGLQALRDIKDPTARAKAGIDLFGKSWGTLAPLINKSNNELKDALATVSAAKVMDDKKIASAKKLAAAQDALVDAFDDFALSVGAAVAEMGPMIEDMAQIVDLGNQIAGIEIGGSSLLTWATRLVNPIPSAINALQDVIDRARGVGVAVDKDATPAIVEFGDRTKEAAEKAYYAQLEAQDLADTLANRADSLARAAYNAQNRIKNLYDEIDQDKTWVDFQLRILGVKEQLDQLAQDFEDKKVSSEEYGLQIQRIFLEGEQGILDFVATLDREVPAEVVTALLADFKAGDIKAVVDRLQAIIDQNPVVAKLTTVGGQTAVPASIRDQGISTNGTYITVNIGVAGNPMETGRTIVRLINDYYSATGQGLNPGPR